MSTPEAGAPSEGADARGELRQLVSALRTHLELRGRSGLVGVGRAPSPRLGVPATDEPAPEPTPSAEVPPALTPQQIGGGCATEAGPDAPTEAPKEGRRFGFGAEGLALVREELGDCRRCRLAGTRKSIVFGVGNPDADLVFVGEAPGADEDEQGEPFVGKAGQLLTKMIEAMGFSRDHVYICNVIKCRPPGNRNPEPDEVESCEPFLKGQLAALRPRLLVALGKFAAHSLCKEQTPITRLRGNWRTYEGIQVMPTYHPAYLLRNPPAKREAWADLQQVIAALRRMGVEPPFPPKG